MKLLDTAKSVNQPVEWEIIRQKKVDLFVKRDDLLHKHISGNKYRKLFYNLLEAKKQGKKILLTFGGAFSNHIAATAAAGKEFGFETIGMIRGDELKHKPGLPKENPTLSFALKQGMHLEFIDRKTYRDEKENPVFIEKLKDKFGDFYLIPQGGTNRLAVQGTREILTGEDQAFDYIVTAVGTGGTIAGLIESASANQTVLGFPALKENFLEKDIRKFTQKNNWQLIRDYHFGGFAKINRQLVSFINRFYVNTGIPLDPVYTGKMFFGLVDLIQNDFFPPGTKILAVHTGGLQGIDAMNKVLRKKKMPLIEIPGFYVNY